MKKRPAEVAVNLREPQFTVAEASELSGVSEKNLRNWMEREVVPPGQKHRLGRWLFSGLDVIRLTGMGDLIRLAVPPADAARISDLVVKRALEFSERDVRTGRRLDEKRWQPAEIVVTYAADGVPQAWLAPRGVLPPHHGDKERAALRRAHIVVPVDVMVHDVFLRMATILEREGLAVSEEEARDALRSRLGPSQPFLEWLGAVERNASGAAVLVGLTLDETEEYLKAAERWLLDRSADEPSDPKARRRYLALHDKHEQARRARLGRASTEG